jgi:hypothetical protein
LQSRGTHPRSGRIHPHDEEGNRGHANLPRIAAWSLISWKRRRTEHGPWQVLSEVLGHKIFLKSPVSVSQPRRLCSGANQPSLTRRSWCSPFAQAPSLSSSDAPIMQSLISWPVVIFWSTLDGRTRVPSLGTQGGPAHPGGASIGVSISS